MIRSNDLGCLPAASALLLVSAVFLIAGATPYYANASDKIAGLKLNPERDSILKSETRVEGSPLVPFKRRWGGRLARRFRDHLSTLEVEQKGYNSRWGNSSVRPKRIVYTGVMPAYWR